MTAFALALVVLLVFCNHLLGHGLVFVVKQFFNERPHGFNQRLRTLNSCCKASCSLISTLVVVGLMCLARR